MWGALSALGSSGRALLTSIITGLLGTVSAFSSTAQSCSRWHAKTPPLLGPTKQHACRWRAERRNEVPRWHCTDSGSLFEALNQQLTDPDVRDLCWAVFSPSVLKVSSSLHWCTR
jgi:hypothetical protein